MAARRESAGLLMYRRRSGRIELFLAHPGGPFFQGKDEGCWTIPKGLAEGEEDLPAAARREFAEETGIEPGEELLPLGTVEQRGGKRVHAWAFAGERDEDQPLRSNTFELEWPPRSGRVQTFPEVDRVAFFDEQTARRKIIPAQAALIDRLLAALEQR